jgi:hypothetical protein
MNCLTSRPLPCFCLLLAILILACAKPSAAPPPPPPSADVVSRVTSAKKVFVSNGGAENLFAYDIPGGANVSYNELYASLKQWFWALCCGVGCH